MTPWGASQHCERVAPGITFHSTASHGGYKLSALLNERVHPAWRQGSGWYEEDCLALVVVWTFPEHFPLAASRRPEIEAGLRHWFPVAFAMVTDDSEVLNGSSY